MRQDQSAPEGVVEPVEQPLMKQRHRSLMAVLAGALGGSKRHKGLRAVQRLEKHGRLPLEELIVFRIADQGWTGDPIGNLGQVILAELIDELLAGGDSHRPYGV